MTVYVGTALSYDRVYSKATRLSKNDNESIVTILSIGWCKQYTIYYYT